MATKQIAWGTGSGNIILTYQGQGDGPVSVVSDPNNIGTVRSKTITIKTTKGSVVTKNVTINQAACPFPVGDVKNFSYTGNVQSVLLPAGTYKLQCWGAQGGSNATDSSYGITAQAGGKGGYSEGVLTLSSPTTVYIFVGGKGGNGGSGTNFNGGWNGGGGSKGSDTFTSGNTSIVSKFGCGGGATDITTITSSMTVVSGCYRRTDASYLARMIVAGGGSGGCMQAKIVSSTTNVTIQSSSFNPVYATIQSSNNMWVSQSYQNSCTLDVQSYKGCPFSSGNIPSGTTSFYAFLKETPVLNSTVKYATGYSGVVSIPAGGSFSGTVPSDAKVLVMGYIGSYGARYPSSVTFTTPTTDITNLSQVGYVGGGTEGECGDSYLKATQNSGYAFGYANGQTGSANLVRGAGSGGGWYGANSNSTSNPVLYVTGSGGGSGFVNTAASAGNRPSGYTGLQLDSGETKAGNTSFPAPGGGNETGHSGNGYARITRIA